MLALQRSFLRRAFRERLASVVDLSVTPPGAVSITAGVIARASGSWLADGFWVGQFATVSGIAGASGSAFVRDVTASTLTLDAPLLSGSGAATISVSIPPIAYEGSDYFPNTAAPYTSETFKTVSMQRRESGKGMVEALHQGYVSLFYPKPYLLALERMAGAVLEAFRPGTFLSYGGVGAYTQQVNLAGAIDDGEWMSCAVSVDILDFG